MPGFLSSVRATLVLIAALLAAPASAGGPVVVELYTSQGCSSCPPADDFLSRELSKRDNVIALALHVDYWDYIGWKDDFADPAFSRRQRAYAQAAGHRSVYTPQMIIGGTDHVVGSHPKEVNAFIRKHSEQASDMKVMLERAGDTIKVVLDPGSVAPQDATVQLVRFLPSATRDIRRGENAGRQLTYTNIVTDLKTVGSWNLRRTKTLRTTVDGDEPVVVLVQKKGFGSILGAAKID